ncbi:MAG: hypothetical protein IJO96_10085 [Oscillospiraceae bacterium]|nr:hypothetical protein [Oscillospiraceae bacterium]
MSQSKFSTVGKKILDVVLQIFFWLFLAVQVFSLGILFSKMKEGVDIFPWGEGLGEDMYVLLIYWFGVLLTTVLLYIFDSIGPCIISRLSYIVMFVIPFVYPFIGAPAFFYETITVDLYTKVISWMVIASFVLMFIDLVRYFIEIFGLIKRNK